jgi:ElaB/YqjD/DUF883 family membrane-anchored ribosome-binding protein
MNTKENKVHNEEFEKAREAAREAYAHFMKAREHMKAAAISAGIELKDSANEQIDESVEMLKEKQAHLIETGTEYIKENPLKSAGFAFLGGYLVSRILR